MLLTVSIFEYSAASASNFQVDSHFGNPINQKTTAAQPQSTDPTKASYACPEHNAITWLTK